MRRKKCIIKKLINVRVSAAEKKILVDNAKKYTRGNLSAWIVLAGINYDASEGIRYTGGLK